MALVVVAFGMIAFVPPATGNMLLVPLWPGASHGMLARATSQGSLLMGAGPPALQLRHLGQPCLDRGGHARARRAADRRPPRRMRRCQGRFRMTVMTTDIAEIDRLQLRGIQILVIASWIATILRLLGGTAIGDHDVLLTLVLGVAANAAPTLMLVRRRHDLAARLVVGTLAAIQPALSVFTMTGHPWQMDGHMFFFVALAALTIMCDWRPIVLASALIALHHLVLQYLAPSWIFTGSGNLTRVCSTPSPSRCNARCSATSRSSCAG